MIYTSRPQTPNKAIGTLSAKCATQEVLKKSRRSGRNLHIVSVLRREEGYMVKYTHLPEGVPVDEARGNFLRRRSF